MTVFLTGGTGFLGSHVAEALMREGWSVVALVRDEKRAGHLKSLGVETCLGDLDSEHGLRAVGEALTSCDAVVHVAGLVKAVRPEDFYRVNVEGTARLADLTIHHARGKRFVLVSSIAAQGPGVGPVERPPDLPEAPVTAYGRSKALGEREVLARAGELAVTILRPPIIYGPRDLEFLKVFQVAARAGIVPVLDPGQVVSLIHARDCAWAVAAATRMERTLRSTYLLDDGAVHTWPEIATVLSEVLKRRVRVVRIPLWAVWVGAWAWETWGRLTATPVVMSCDKVHEAKARYWVAGCSAAREDLGYTPEVSLRKGFEETVKWAQKSGLM